MPITTASSLVFKTIGALVLSVLPVSVKDNAGKAFQGELDGFTPSTLLLRQSGKVVEYPFDDLLLVRPDEAEEKTGPAYRVTLVGGSTIAAQKVVLTNSELLIEPRRQNPLRVPVKQVKAIRFRPSSVATDPQWLGNIDRENRGDTLVIRRPGDRLDPQQGVVVSIADGSVVFDLDGDQVDAPIDRLEGVIFGGVQSIFENAEIRVTDIYGSRWSVAAIEPSRGDQPLQMRLTPSLVHELPLHQIESIRFTGGFSMLSDGKPAAASFRAYVKTDVDDALLKDFFGPTRDGEADLLMLGGSSIEYRIEPGYQFLAGSVARHASVTNAGLVTVTIELDGKSVWKQELRDAQPRGFQLPVDQSRRVAIKVDYGEDGDLGDTVRISRPRLLK